jgi:hypothetical protein
MARQHSFSIRGVTAVGWVLAGLLACADPPPTGPVEPTVAAARGGGGPGPKVDEAVPNEAPQDTILTVRVVGSGFDEGSVARWLLAGQSTQNVVVRRTTFVDDQHLDAEVEIAADAEVALYDVEVMTTRGKKGIGSELFAVKLKGGPPPSDTPVSATFRDYAGDRVRSDGGGSYEAVILAIGNLSLDARGTTPRVICFNFAGQVGAPADPFCDDGYLTTADPDVAPLVMAPGTSMTTRAQVTWVRRDDSDKGYNWFLRFGQDCDGADVAADRLTVTHELDGVTWTFTGATAILCQLPTKGKPEVTEVGRYAMPFQLTVVK